MNERITKRSISDYLDVEYKDYSTYVLEQRAVPSVIDGFKPVQRKIIHVANKVWKSGSEKPMKVFQLTGKVSSDCFYHHGDASMNKAIIGMAQQFKNNVPLLDDTGQFGTLRSPDAGAPRYIGTKLTENFRKIYRDSHLLTPKFEEGYEIEPNYYLPIIPTVLLNGGGGIAVGYSTNILNRNPKEVVTACLNALAGKAIKTLKPSLNGFKGRYVADAEVSNKWHIHGKYEVVNTSTIRVTELAPSTTYEKWEELLDKLVDTKKIKSYEDNSKDNIDYVIKMNRDDLDKLSKDPESLNKFFKLSETSTEYFTTLDEHGKLKLFDNAEDIVSYFVDFRLSYYHKRKEARLAKIGDEMNLLDNRAKFIKAILEETIVVNKKSKEDIIKQIEKAKLDRRNGDFEYLLRMPISSLSKENWARIQQELKEKKAELREAKGADPKEEYRKELESLKLTL
jgi:DNA gyrase/topoisomerase IV subunit A